MTPDGYCEAMLYDYEPDWQPPGIVAIDRPDLLAWKRPGWPIWSSRVVYAKWTDRDADARIAEVLAFFGDTPFNWHVGPSSSPSDLIDRLGARDLVIGARPRMMTATLPLAGSWRAADVRIVEVADEASARASLVLARHEGAELERALTERLAYVRLSSRRGGYLVAYLGDEPVANAGYRFSRDGRCLYLTGAETVAAYRGRGIYQALVAHRARMAAERGCSLLSILANTETSAPILARREFVDHGALPRLSPRAVA